MSQQLVNGYLLLENLQTFQENDIPIESMANTTSRPSLTFLESSFSNFENVAANFVICPLIWSFAFPTAVLYRSTTEMADQI
jgi:hypothetical protein